MKSSIHIALLSFILVLPNAYAAIYQWQDANGETHYGQVPPDNVDAKEMNIKTAPASSAAQDISNAQKLESDLKKADQKATEEQQKANQAAQDEHIRAINCERAQAHLKDIESKVRIRIINPGQSEVQRLTPEERDEDIKNTNEAIEKYCNPAKP